MYQFFADLVGSVRARRAAEALCAGLHPEEPLHGSWVCANEPGRFVVRVFWGNRALDPNPVLAPPWRGCLIVAVDKVTRAAEPVADDGPYRPTLR